MLLFKVSYYANCCNTRPDVTDTLLLKYDQHPLHVSNYSNT